MILIFPKYIMICRNIDYRICNTNDDSWNGFKGWKKYYAMKSRIKLVCIEQSVNKLGNIRKLTESAIVTHIGYYKLKTQ